MHPSSRPIFLARVFFVFTLATSLHAQTASVLREQKINEVQGGFPGALAPNGAFGAAVANLGDLDGDGVVDLAVSAPFDNDGGSARGAVWILLLERTGRVKSANKLSQTQGGFTGTLADLAAFGTRMGEIGDLDGDGRRELVVSAGRPSRAYVLHLRADGTLSAQSTLASTDPVFGGSTEPSDFLKGGLADAGDLDGDGIEDLAWGAPGDDDGGEDAGAVWLVLLNADGSAKAAHKIAPGSGGFTGDPGEDAYFGYGVGRLGDVNGDGQADLGVIDPFGGAYGRFWTLFLDANAQVIGHRALTVFDVDMSWRNQAATLRPGIGYGFAALGDMDGDGIREVALGEPGYRGGGAVPILFLASDGSLRKRMPLGAPLGGLGVDPNRFGFGSALAFLGDLDGDGAPELAVGAPSDTESGQFVGSVSILSLAPSAVRNGSGVNPLTLTEAGEPRLGQAWNVTLDCSGHASGIALIQGWNRPLAGVVLPQGELLVDTFGGSVFSLSAPHTGGSTSFAPLVPNQIGLVNRFLYVQGLCTGAPGARFSNALDLLIGR